MNTPSAPHATPPEIKAHPRVEAFDLLRALAVGAVLAFHYMFRGAVGDEGFTQVSLPALAPYAKYGFFGVQMFFVISGFVIAYSTEGRTAIEFAIARIARIYPGFVVCMTLTFLLTLAIGAPQLEVHAVQWFANLAIDAPALRQPFVDGAYWSLVCEVTFYGWVALLMMLGWYRRYVDIIVTAWMALAVANREVHSAIAQHVFLTNQSGFFAAGMILYEIYRGRRDVAAKLLLVLATIVAVGQALDFAAWSRDYFKVPFDDGFVVILTLFAVTAVALSIRVRHLPLPPRAIIAIGGVTYPVYLIHQNIGYMIFNRFEGAAPAWLLILGTAAAMIVAAWSIWRFVERPGQRITKRLLNTFALRLSEQASLNALARWRKE
jgi:peptidoglycan/LPS O-acetylase OafA/YrhL